MWAAIQLIFWGVIFLAALKFAWPWIVAIVASIIPIAAALIGLALAIAPGLLVLALIVGSVLGVIGVISRWRAIAVGAMHVVKLGQDKLGRVARPKEWSGAGACALAAWLFALSVVAIIPYGALGGPAGVVGVVLYGLFAIGMASSVALGLVGIGWLAVEWLRARKKTLAGYSKFCFFAGCALMPVGAFQTAYPPAMWAFLFGLLLIIAGVAMIAVADLKGQKQHGTNG